MKETEKHMLSPVDTEGIIGVVAWSACDHQGRRRCVAVEREKTTLVAHVKQYAMMRARQEEEYQELSKVITHKRQGKLLAMMERKQNLISEAPEDLRTRIFQEIRDLDEKMSGED